MVPTMVLLGLFIAYPFVRGIMLSVTSSRVGVPGDFVGLANYYKIWNDDIFRTAVYNTFLYTGVTTVFKLAMGLWLAHAAQPQFQGQGLHPRLHPAPLHHSHRAVDLRLEVDVRPDLQRHQLVPVPARRRSPAASTGWAIPISPWSPSWSINIWRGVPFFAISLLAGLQTISPELNEAAAIDGAKPWQRFWYVTWPLLLPVTMVVVLFSVIQTFADFQIVYVMTGGGPANATHLFATYAYQIGIGTGLLSEGAAISLAMFPILLLVVIVQLLYIRRVETR